jgi:hopanoid biosynthesis associated protein HpnK
MAFLEPARRLIVNADDFGRSSGINQAVLRAHCDGILTTASLMVNGDACDEAVAIARQNPNLGVGLHLSLVCGRSSLPHDEIPGLVDEQDHFSQSPVATGFRYFACRSLRTQLHREIAEQFARFQQTGLPMDHVNGHLNLHLHPTIFGLLMREARTLNVRRFRLTRDPLGLNLGLARGEWFYRLSHAVIFTLLSRRAVPRLRQLDIRHTRSVFGLLQNGRVTEDYILGLLPRLPPGDTELYAHPTADEPTGELAALLSPKVKALARELKLERIRYQDL